MNRNQASRARIAALRSLAYRAWYVDPVNASIPPLDILSSPNLQRREQHRQLRRAQFGMFDTVAPITAPRLASNL